MNDETETPPNSPLSEDTIRNITLTHDLGPNQTRFQGLRLYPVGEGNDPHTQTL